MTTNCEVLEIMIDDANTGIPTTIPVTVTYLVERDTDYGSDIDGRQGVTKEEVFILDTSIPHGHLKHLTINQVAELADRALTIILELAVSR